jgi:hypothetical protein
MSAVVSPSSAAITLASDPLSFKALTFARVESVTVYALRVSPPLTAFARGCFVGVGRCHSMKALGVKNFA